MSAQAVLSMIAPVLPAAPQGPSDADASGFEGLLAAMLSADAAAGAAAPASKGTDPTAVEETLAVDGAAGLPGLLTTPLSSLPSPPPRTGNDLPTAAEGEAQVPSIAAAGTPGPQAPTVPTSADGSEPAIGPQAPSDASTDKEPKLQAPPAFAPVREAGPQVLPAPTPARGPQPVQPIAASDDALAALPPGPDAVDAAPSADQPPAAKSGAVPAPTPPPLRPLAERTSRAADQTAPASNSAAPADAKADGPATSPSAPTDQPAKPAAAAAAAPAASPPASDAGPPPAEAAPAGEPVSGQAEAAAPAREHSLSTLSRAAVDATAQIAAQILRKLEGRSTRFEIALRPAELGRVDVKLDIDAEGRLNARLAFDNPAAATDLRGRVDDLRRQLEAAGFQLADDAFEFAERDSGSSGFDRGQDARHGQNRAFAAAARLNADIDIAQPPQWLALSLSPSGVDMKV